MLRVLLGRGRAVEFDCDTCTVSVVNRCDQCLAYLDDGEGAPMPAAEPESDGPSELIKLDELTRRTGLSVRNIRFYTSRGLVPPPIRRGRSGFYSADHIARLELVRELQAHGFTLAAIERY